MAADLTLARNTVVDVYDQLTAEGWLVARHGSGTIVAERPPIPPQEPDVASPLSPVAAKPSIYDLRPGGPDLSSFPRSAWLAASRRALSDAPDAAFGYGDPPEPTSYVRRWRATSDEPAAYAPRRRESLSVQGSRRRSACCAKPFTRSGVPPWRTRGTAFPSCARSPPVPIFTS